MSKKAEETQRTAAQVQRDVTRVREQAAAALRLSGVLKTKGKGYLEGLPAQRAALRTKLQTAGADIKETLAYLDKVDAAELQPEEKKENEKEVHEQ